MFKTRCKDSKQHHVMFHELYSVSLLLCIAQNVRFEIPYKVLYFETPFVIIFKYYAWVSCGPCCNGARGPNLVNTITILHVVHNKMRHCAQVLPGRGLVVGALGREANTVHVLHFSSFAVVSIRKISYLKKNYLKK